jgi:hypothetical protein
MKTFCLTMMIALFLFFCTNGLLAQTTQTKLNQVELMKQLIGSWKADYAKDTIAVWDAKSYGTGLECNYKFVSNGRTVKEGKQLWGYDTKLDKYIATSLPKGMDLEIDVYWFTSKNRCEALIYSDIPHPEGASLKWVIEFKSPDMFLETVTEINKPVRTITYNRVK